jgi:hypothetical protein
MNFLEEICQIMAEQIFGWLLELLEQFIQHLLGLIVSSVQGAFE